MPQTIIDLLNKAAHANKNDACRRGNIIYPPPAGKLILTGDLHGHKRNLERIINYADLGNNPDTHIILHEVIHGGPQDEEGGCLSYRLLFDVAQLKLKFPRQVHTIMGNHDTAFITESEVIKAGREMNRAMCAAITQEFREAAEAVISAIKSYLFSQALAVKCQNRIWMSHSLPSDRLADKFDPGIFDRELRIDDLVRPGSAYILTWGRRQSHSLLEKMAALLDVDIFVLGHQPQERGYTQAGARTLIVASDHNHGCILPIDPGRPYTMQELIESMVSLASLT